MARLRDVVVDAAHPASLARFWAQALDGYEVLPYDDEEIARLASLGLTPETDPSVKLGGPPGSPDVCFQLITDVKAVKNRMHFDLFAADLDAEVARLCGLGASVFEAHDGWTVLRDPEGNELCVFQEQAQGD